MTRVVVIGPYPPTADPGGDVVLAQVRRMRAEGLSVDVVSSEPSAAGSHGRPDSVVGAARIARVVRGADRVLWFPERGIGRRAAWPLRRALATVPRLECVTGAPAAADPGRAGGPFGVPEPAGPRAWWSPARLRAGAPTYLRSLRSRAARARSGR